MQTIQGIPVFGPPLVNAVEQMLVCMRPENRGYKAALMADHHLGYAVPVGGVIAYQNAISPSGVGFDIACGNKAVLTDMVSSNISKKHLALIMDEIVKTISFGIGRNNTDESLEGHPLFKDPAWDIPIANDLKRKASLQLGTVGSGNHYIDIFVDEFERIWVGCHFGSRGFGHGIASHFIKEGGGRDGINVDPVVLDADSELGKEYIACMNLAGRYAYAGRDWVCSRVIEIMGGGEQLEIHNHHNFAWKETHFGEELWVVRKGATPAYHGQRGFIGGTMAENAVIVEGVHGPLSDLAMNSTVHGAGRVLSRTQAAGKRRWKKGKQVKLSEGLVSQAMMDEKVHDAGVELRGAGVDEAPQCYKRLNEVLEEHTGTIRILHTLRPIGVAMAGADVVDPFKD